MFIINEPDPWQFVSAHKDLNLGGPIGIAFLALVALIVVALAAAIIFARVAVVTQRNGVKSELPVSAYQDRQERMESWSNSSQIVAFASFVMTIFIGLAMVNAAPVVSSNGQTRSDSLQEWVSDTYDVQLSEQGTRQLIRGYIQERASEPVAILYEGEYISVKLIPLGSQDDSYILVKDGTLEPLPVPNGK